MKFSLDIFFEIAICFKIVGIDDMFLLCSDPIRRWFSIFFLRKLFFVAYNLKRALIFRRTPQTMVIVERRVTTLK